MIPEDKAEELVDKYKDFVRMDNYDRPRKDMQKQCALIAVDEILNIMIKTFKWDINHNGNIDFWQQVKQEINNL